MTETVLFTLGSQAVTLGDAALVIGGTVSTVGAIRQGNAANAAARFESDQLRQQAERDRQIAALDAQEFENDERRRRARFVALQAGSGTTLEGTPLAVLGDLAGEAAFQQLRIMAGGETAATRAENQARLRVFEGRSARRAGFTRAGATLLTAASQLKGGSRSSVRTDAAGRVIGGI